jgi:phosphotriesterase-related protein
MTVNGLIDAQDMGFTLVHEHLFADLRSYEEQLLGNIPVDTDEVIEVVLPHLTAIREFGCRTLIDCTATHLGRHPDLIKRLSDASGLHMLTTTGNYLSADGRFIAPYVKSDSIEQLAGRWTSEWRNGISDTGIRPGLIKLGMNGGPLSELEKKVFEAAVITHQRTGLPIAVHIGPWREVEPEFNARSALEQIETLKRANVSPSAWVWVHAQNETARLHHVQAARQGAWISFDGLSTDTVDLHIECVVHMRSEGLLHRTLVSHDAGWYNAGQPRGGTFRSFDTAFTTFIPALRQRGFTQTEIDQIFVTNPAEAFSIRVA